ncbi:MAG: hypothetical protein ACM34K_18110 [Bacillota bacterium]
MQNPKYLFFLILFFFAGCASVKAPKNWLPEPDQVPSDPYGSWIEVDYSPNKTPYKTKFMGELISVTKDTLFLLNDSFLYLPVSDIKSARLAKYNSNYTVVSGLTFLGSLSTISNGWFLIFTLPTWLVGGSITASARSYAPLIDYPVHGIEELVPYARFPQGLPKNFNRRSAFPKGFLKPLIAAKDSLNK